MNIRYPSRSKFLEVCETTIRENRAELEAGRAVGVVLEEGGYDGRVIVSIESSNRSTFSTDWESTDETRFPARIKAAAAALLNCNFDGRFEISHAGGTLTIRGA